MSASCPLVRFATEAIKGIYDSLMEVETPRDFGKKLDVTANKTAVMERIGTLSPDVAKLLLEEALDEHYIRFIPAEYASKLINKYSPRDVNAQNYMYESLGWKRKKFAWDTGPQKRCWYREENPDHPTFGSKGVWLEGSYRPVVVNRVDDPKPKPKKKIEAGYEPIKDQILRIRNLLNDK